MSLVQVEAGTEADDGVAIVRLANPPVNALSNGLLDELGAAVESLRSGDLPKALVVWGGETVFAAGADVEEFRPVSSDRARGVAKTFRAALDTLADFPRPTIAAICGYALGGGLEVALACDFRVCGDNSRLGFPEIQLGIIPGGGGTQRASRLVGPAKAKDLIFSGRHVRAQEALEMGLVDRIAGPDDVFGDARTWAAKLGAGAVAAMGEAKAAIDEGLDSTLAGGLDIEADHFAAVHDTDDAHHGIDSFVENGPGKATFEGR